jgi:hypothetical protein
MAQELEFERIGDNAIHVDDLRENPLWTFLFAPVRLHGVQFQSFSECLNLMYGDRLCAFMDESGMWFEIEDVATVWFKNDVCYAVVHDNMFGPYGIINQPLNMRALNTVDKMRLFKWLSPALADVELV